MTTTTQPVVNDGNPEHSCSGTSALGALQLATAGNWSGHWYGGELGYLINAIEGETHLYESGVRSYYWSFWLNDTYKETEGPCLAQLGAGDRVLFLPLCDEACPTGPEPTPLEIEAPATAAAGEQVSVAVKQYNTKAEPAPAVGAKIAWKGGSATTDSQGHAILTFSGASTYNLQVTGAESGPPAVRTEASICVHNGNDGTCGTQAPSNSPGVKGPSSSGTIINNSSAKIETAEIAGVKNGHVYTRHAAPRLLRGSVVVTAGAQLRTVQISLKRKYRGRCYGFSGSRVRFVSIKCKKAASWFSVGAKASFSYLLPARLPAGRYTYDIEGVDGAGQATKLVSGVSSVVFQVK